MIGPAVGCARGASIAACALAAALAVAAPALPAPEEPPPQAPGASGPDPEEPAPAPGLLVKGFGDVRFATRDDDATNTFSLGELALFLTSELAPGLSVLVEIAVEPEEGSNPVIELERYVIRWAPRDYVGVALGRMHTPLGYWNQTFHHGAWFQTTIDRPVVYRWEHDGGVLPVHELGVQLAGSVALPGVALEYSASVSNGRAPDPTQVQDLRDADAAKAFNLWAGVTPRSLRALRFGGVVRLDRIPAEPAGEATGGDSLDERIVGAFVAFTPRRAEALAEVLRIEHEARDTGETWRTLGLYVQAALRFDRVKPYYRYDYLDTPASEPFYRESGTLVRNTLGVRYDPWSWAALKLEFQHENPQVGESFRAVVFQAAFTF